MGSTNNLSIYNVPTQQNIASADTFSSQMDASYQAAASLLSEIEGATWSGEARDAFIAYLTLVMHYHKDLTADSKKLPTALKKINSGLDKYESDGKVTAVKRL